MSNFVPKSRRREGNPSLLANKIANYTLKCSLVDSTQYTLTEEADKITDIPVNARIATVTVAGVTWNSSLLRLTCTSPVVFTSVAPGAGSASTGELFIFWFDTGTPSTSTIEVAFDTFSNGMPVTLDNRNVELNVTNGLLAQY